VLVLRLYQLGQLVICFIRLPACHANATEKERRGSKEGKKKLSDPSGPAHQTRIMPHTSRTNSTVSRTDSS
jgi:hypothetical protein